MTIETTYSQAREQLKTLMDRAVDDREVILVRRRTGGDVAMIAADELQSLVETAHLLRSTKNAQRLLTALTRARTESVEPTTLADLQKQDGVRCVRVIGLQCVIQNFLRTSNIGLKQIDAQPSDCLSWFEPF
jgi:antitoxin YefM